MGYIPEHRCVPMCDPDNGVHCLPTMGTDGLKLQDFQVWFLGLCEVVKIAVESDITPATIRALNLDPKKYTCEDPEHFPQGYLMWVRELDQ